MSRSFSEWLSLREAADHVARSHVLTRDIVAALPPVHPIRIVDLGAGTGSNRRYLSPFLPSDQEWLLVDRDAALLATIRAAPDVHTRQQYLGTLDDAIFDGRQLVTASALLDLVSVDWLQALARECRRVGALALFALTYNGHSRCSPADPEDELVRELMNRHQRRSDHGFGRAAGPDAVDAAARAFAAAGYRTRRERSDWALGPDARELQRQLVEGWAEAALELTPADATKIRGWLARRLDHVDSGRSRIVVGHEDLGAWPPGV